MIPFLIIYSIKIHICTHKEKNIKIFSKELTMKRWKGSNVQQCKNG